MERSRALRLPLSLCVCRPDRSGNRYCINLVCVAGEPVEADVAAAAGGEEQAEAEAGEAEADGAAAAPGL